jgi:hypothetical protein
MREFGQFSVQVKDEVLDRTTVLFMYHFIDGPIVSAEDARRLVSYPGRVQCHFESRKLYRADIN